MINKMNVSTASLRGYELKEPVGSGGFGTVYRAFQSPLGRDVAVKVIRPEYASHPDFIRRFMMEAEFIAHLEHPHIVPLYDYWTDADGVYLVMRWLPQSLSSALKRGPWTLEAIAKLLDHIASALSVAHRAGIVHRDVKPDNILLDDNQNAYLADFGIAKDLSALSQTDDGVIVGSPAYIAPEQIKGEPVTIQADIYSLGLVIYETLTHEKAYPKATSPIEIIQHHLNTPLPRVSDRRTDLPDSLDEILRTATAKDPSQRYASVERFAAAFRAAIFDSVTLYAKPESPESSFINRDVSHFLHATTASAASQTAIVKSKPQRLRDRLSQYALRSFVGRAQELSEIESLLANRDIRVIFINGIGGIGKSSLLDTFISRSSMQGTSVIKFDCRAIKPTEEGLLHELNSALGQGYTDIEQAVIAIGQLAESVILAFDTYELFRLMDTWMRQQFVPLLPENVCVLLFGREAPVSAWYTTPDWQALFRSVELGPLAAADADRLLSSLGIAPTDVQRVRQFTHGHPLALTLAAATMAQHPELNLKEIESQHIVTELTRLYLADVPVPLTRVALEAASVVRRTTHSLLRAMLPGNDVQDTFGRLQMLPFVQSGSDGLVIHDLVKHAIVTQLRASDPERYHAYRRAAWEQLRSEFSLGSREMVWRYTADMIYLSDNPGVHDGFFPSDAHLYAIEPARAEDHEAIRSITLRHNGPQMLKVIDYWLQVLPESFHVARGRHTEVAGFYSIFRVQAHNNRLHFDDPLTSFMWRHLCNNPIPEPQSALFLLRWCTAETGDEPSGVMGSLFLDIKRTYMDTPQARRVYTACRVKSWLPILASVGFRADGTELSFDSQQFSPLVNDFGPQLVLGWMAGIVDAELGITPSVILRTDAHELVVDSKHIGLTPLEFKLMNHLAEHEGSVISRDQLLNTVWGYDWAGGSNVVDAMVRSLRKKMGSQGKCIETVKGVGYKLRWS